MTTRWPIAIAVLACSACSSNSPKHPAPSAAVSGEPFSFFVTSLAAMQRLSDNPQGFGGDLRFGERGPGAGLRGADKICATIAETSMPGSGDKGWRAFLSATADEHGKQVDAIDRIGAGPWYDRLGRLVAQNKDDLLATRPMNADSAIVNDLPNEDGIPNHQPDPGDNPVDNHDTLTGTNDKGQLHSQTATCKDWTSALGDRESEGAPRVGHSWPRTFGGPAGPGGPGGPPSGFPFGDGGVPPGFPPRDGSGPAPGFPPAAGGGAMFPPAGVGDTANWMSALDEAGCAPGASVVEMGPPNPNMPTVGSGGGYGGIYCLALKP
jgi:hypothetical protein